MLEYELLDGHLELLDVELLDRHFELLEDLLDEMLDGHIELDDLPQEKMLVVLLDGYFG